MTWVPSNPSSSSWNRSEPYDLFDFLLMEDGYRMLQENMRGILLEYSWSENQYRANSFILNNPNSTNWTKQ